MPFPSPLRESEVAQSCLTLSDPMDCSPPGSSVHEICQARVLEWGAIAFSEYLSIRVIKKEYRPTARRAEPRGPLCGGIWGAGRRHAHKRLEPQPPPSSAHQAPLGSPRRPGLAWRGGEEFGYLTGSQPLWTQRGPAGGGAGNRCPSSPAFERSSWANGRRSDAPGLVHRSADHCGNPGGGEQGRRRCPGGGRRRGGQRRLRGPELPGSSLWRRKSTARWGRGRREGTPWGHLEAERKV